MTGTSVMKELNVWYLFYNPTATTYIHSSNVDASQWTQLSSFRGQSDEYWGLLGIWWLKITCLFVLALRHGVKGDPPQSLKVGPGNPPPPLKFKSGTPEPPSKLKGGTPGPPSKFKSGALIIFLHCLFCSRQICFYLIWKSFSTNSRYSKLYSLF